VSSRNPRGGQGRLDACNIFGCPFEADSRARVTLPLISAAQSPITRMRSREITAGPATPTRPPVRIASSHVTLPWVHVVRRSLVLPAPAGAARARSLGKHILPLQRISLQSPCYFSRSTRRARSAAKKKRAMQRYPSFEQALGQEIANAREEKGLSQRALSALCKRRINYIQLIEAGRQPVTASGLAEIGLMLGTTGALLLEKAEQAVRLRPRGK
jgi:ribosome-binding protein aMBF1 (putative translation factor)